MIWDLHDAVMLYCPWEQARQCAKIMDDTLCVELNEKLRGPVKLTGSTAIVTNWAADKSEDYDKWLAKQPEEVRRKLTPPSY